MGCEILVAKGSAGVPLDSHQRLVDKIYEAAFVPEMWPELLQDIADTVDSVGGTVFVTDLSRVPRWTSSHSIQGVLKEWVADDWITKNQRTHRMVALGHAGFVTASDVFSAEELAADREHEEFLRPRGLGSSTGTFIPMPTGEVVVYSFERALHLPTISRDEIAVVDALRPHLARTGAISARLGLERARTAAETFQLLGLPAAALSRTGRVMVANFLFEALIPSVVMDQAQRLVLTDPSADALLGQCLQGGPAARLNQVASIPIAATEEFAPHIIHLLPVCGAAHDLFSNIGWMCVAVPVLPGKVPGAEVLQGLFDLTPAEAKAARAVAGGETVNSLAEKLGLSRETIRAQLKAVFAKTGVRRQADLIALLAGKALQSQSGAQ